MIDNHEILNEKQILKRILRTFKHETIMCVCMIEPNKRQRYAYLCYTRNLNTSDIRLIFAQSQGK